MRTTNRTGTNDGPDDQGGPSRRARHNATQRQRRRKQSWLVPTLVVAICLPLLIWAWNALAARRTEAALAPGAMAGAYQLDHARRLASLRAAGGALPQSADPHLRIHLEANGEAMMSLGFGADAHAMRGTWKIERGRIRLQWREDPATGMFVVSDGAVDDGVLEFRDAEHGELVFVKGPYTK